MPDITFADTITPANAPPALSATSDMPGQVFEPSTVEIAAPTPALAAEAPAAPPAPAPESKAAEPAAPAAATEPESKPVTEAKPEPITERFADMAAQRRAAEQRADQLAEALQRSLAAIEALTPKPAAAEPTPEDVRPNRQAFDNPDAYDDALIEWSTRQATEVATAEMDRRAADAKATETKAANDAAVAEQNKHLADDWAARTAKAKADKPDYDTVAFADDLPVTIPMAHAMLNSEAGADILYHLGQNREEATRLAAITNPVKMAIEIGKIEAKLAAPPGAAVPAPAAPREPPAPVTRAPPPIPPSRPSAAAAVERSLEELGNEPGNTDYFERRQAQILAARRPNQMFGGSSGGAGGRAH